ncbi:MAG: transporter substrate-binding domain-containing protein [Mesorhizobium sp.]
MSRNSWRLISTTAACGLAIMLSACSSSEEKPSGVDPSAVTWQNIESKGKVVVGVKYDTIPYGYVPQGQETPIGFDIDLATEIAKRWGIQLELQPVTSANRIANLTTSKVDFIAASIVHTRERDEKIDYSVTYIAESMKLMVPMDSAINTIADLDGKTVALAQGSIQSQMMKQMNPQARVLEMKDWADVYVAVQQGRAEAAFDTAGSLGSAVAAAKEAGVSLKVVGEDGIGNSPFAFGVRQGDALLRDKLNFTLMEIVEDGTYDTIFKKWWGDLYAKTYQVEVWPK